MKLKLYLYLTLFVFSCSSYATNQYIDFAGIKIGGTLMYPSCNANKNLEVIPNKNGFCYFQLTKEQNSEVGFLLYNKEWSNNKLPRIFSEQQPHPSYNLIGVRINEKQQIVGIEIPTKGYSTQDEILSRIIEKYGEPTVLEYIPIPNKNSDAKYSVMAGWKISKYIITFIGHADEKQIGILIIETDSEFSNIVSKIKKKEKY